MNKEVDIKNFPTVLGAVLAHFAVGDGEEKQCWCDAFNEMLDTLRDEDFFGTEGQNDPRGDQR
jgi:hypothetical protein